MKKAFSFAGLLAVVVMLIGMALTLSGGRITGIAKWHYIIAGILIVGYGASRATELITAVKSRKARFGALFSVYSILLFAVIAVLNIIGALTNVQIADITEEGLYSLSDQTKAVLKKVDNDLTFYAFFSGANAGLKEMRDVDRLLRTYAATSKKVKLKVIDPEIDIAIAESFNVYENATLILEYNKQVRKVNIIKEESITNSIIRLLDSTAKKVCFISGNAELSIEGEAAQRFNGLGNLKALLERNLYETGTVDISSISEIPPECSVTAVIGPTTPLATNELVILDNYLQLGGRLLVAEDAGQDTRLNLLTTKWGVKFDNDVMLEKYVEGTFLDGGFSPTATKITMNLTITDYNRSDPIVQDLSVKHPINMLRAKSLTIPGNLPDITVRELFRSKQESWGEAMVGDAMNGRAILNPKEGDLPGPLVIAASVSYTTQLSSEQLRGYSRQARLVVIGNSVWMQNMLFDETRNFNSDLALNMIGWLAGLEEYLAIGSRTAQTTSMYLSQRKKELLFNVTVVFLPELILMMGLLVWWIRR